MRSEGRLEVPWSEEKDWLVEVVAMDMEEDYAESLDYIGRLLAFAFVTNTRAVGKIGNNDQRFPAYELWFSFTSEENKKLSWTSCAKIDTPILTRSRH